MYQPFEPIWGPKSIWSFYLCMYGYKWTLREPERAAEGPLGPEARVFFISIQCEIQFGLFHILSLVLEPTHKPKQNCDRCQRQMIASKQIYFPRFCKCDTGHVLYFQGFFTVDEMNEREKSPRFFTSQTGCVNFVLGPAGSTPPSLVSTAGKCREKELSSTPLIFRPSLSKETRLRVWSFANSKEVFFPHTFSTHERTFFNSKMSIGIHLNIWQCINFQSTFLRTCQIYSSSIASDLKYLKLT